MSPPPITGALQARMIALRRELHEHPELSWGERESARRVARALGELGVGAEPVSGTGLVAEISGRRAGPLVALRADLDALPLAEATGLPFASTVPGVMHACGHDAHSAMLFGAAALLHARRPPLPVRLLWQPAEELGTGARALREAGVLEGVAAIFGVHVDNRYPTGTLVVTDGAVNASSDGFRVTVRGRGGHAARPHETVDAVVTAAAIVLALQTVVAREIDPADPAVLTVGRLQAGEVSNVIAETAVLEGTLRALDSAVRARLAASLTRVATATGTAHGAGVEVEILEGTPLVYNAPEMAALARSAAAEVVGSENLRALRRANLGGEDFGCYLERVPGAFIRVGAGRAGATMHPAHSCRFDLDEGCLSAGAAWLAQVAARAGERLAA